MRIREKLERALALCGYPGLMVPLSYRKIGDGAWHDAYLVTLPDGRRLVVRLRKQIIYGEREPFDESRLHEDYVPVGLYYAQANRVQPGVCPDEYRYHIHPDLTFTVETYMGPVLILSSLSPDRAYAYGRQVGDLFGELHGLPAPRPGFGDLAWDGREMAGRDRRPLEAIWRDEREDLWAAFEELSGSGWHFESANVGRALERGLAERSFLLEPVTLVNGDVTPENFIARRGRFAGLVDPVPALNNGARFAAFFVFCYRFLLPALADAPRYARHRFDRQRSVMGAIAAGFVDGYVRSGEAEMRRQVRIEYFFYLLRFAYRWWTILGSRPDRETYLRNGTSQQIGARLRRCLSELEAFDLDAVNKIQ